MVAFIFPGQGSQYAGMGKDLYETFPASRQIFTKADQVLGWPISQDCFSAAEENLKNTAIQQPAILTVSIAVLAALAEKVPNLKPAFVAGLSLGEYSALVATGALEFSDALLLVKKRAELMEEAARENPGKMAAIIGLDREVVKSVLQASQQVGIANLNCPGQVVISGSLSAVEEAKLKLLEKGARRAIDLEVSGAFHSALMRPAAEKFRQVLATVNLRNPKIPLISNVKAEITRDKEKIRANLEKQLYSAVLWEDSIRLLISQGVRRFYEIGPGKVLKGLLRKIDESIEVVSIANKEDLLRGEL